MSVVTTKTNIAATTNSQLALARNALRTFLEFQNKSGDIITVKFDTDFVTPTSGVQKIAFSSVPTGGAWTITYGGNETTSLAYNADASAIQTAVQALAAVGSNNMTVTGNYTTGFTFTGAGNLANIALQALGVNQNTLTDNTVLSDAVQNVNFSAPPKAGGTFVLSFKGISTPPLASDISDTNLKLALNALASINGGVDAVAQDPISKNFAVSMSGVPLAGAVQPLIVIGATALTTAQGTSTGVFKLYATPKPLTGTYKIMCGAYKTTALASTALAATIQAALEALPNVGAGNVTVAAIGTNGNLNAGYTITLGGALALTTLPVFQVDASSNGLEATGLDAGDDGDDTPDICIVHFNTITPAQGPVAVTMTVVEDVAGAAARAITTTITTVTVGVAPVAEGVDIAANADKLYDDEVPMGAIYIKSTGASSPVVILEG